MDSALATFIACLLAGCVCIVGGVAYLFGTGWALICGGWCFIAAAVFLKRGISE
jgi:hypothetical protein